MVSSVRVVTASNPQERVRGDRRADGDGDEAGGVVEERLGAGQQDARQSPAHRERQKPLFVSLAVRSSPGCKRRAASARKIGIAAVTDFYDDIA
jgi:hypothetical protein